MAEDRQSRLLVLLDALERYYTHLTAEDVEGRRLFRETEQWFADVASRGPQSFEGLCAEVGLDPVRIRDALARRHAGSRKR
jgi:hypothetical protein